MEADVGDVIEQMKWNRDRHRPKDGVEIRQDGLQRKLDPATRTVDADVDGEDDDDDADDAHEWRSR